MGDVGIRLDTKIKKKLKKVLWFLIITFINIIEEF